MASSTRLGPTLDSSRWYRDPVPRRGLGRRTPIHVAAGPEEA
jgi:hypothetical protein